MTQEELDKDMIESIEMWLHEIEPKWVEKELAWLEELRTRILEEKSEKTISPWKKIHTYKEEIHEGDMEKMLLELSVGKGEKRTKTALPDRIVDILESEKPMIQDEDFRREMREWVELMVAASFPEQDNDFISEEDYRSVIKQTARHFAQWGAEHLKK